MQKVLNSAGSSTIAVPNAAETGSTCCAVFDETEPWRDEVLLYRDKEVAFVGPLITVSGELSGGSLFSQDLFFWMEQRFLSEDFHFNGDVAQIFEAVFDAAYRTDTSPNITVSTRPTGVDGVRDFRGRDFQRAADILRELARTGMDFTTNRRQILAGGAEIFENQTPLILHDDGVLNAEVVKEGTNLATDVGVSGATVVSGGDPVHGRSVASVDTYGLIQKSFSEGLIRDTASANANARARLETMQPAPLRVKVALSQEAAFGFGDLICGRRVDVRLKEAAGCIEVMEVMRLVTVDVGVTASEQGVVENISIDLIPIGIGEES